MKFNSLNRNRGFTLIEVVVVTVVFSILVVAYLTFFTEVLVFSRRIDERRLAVQKAISLMEEVRAFVESGAETQIDLLDDFDDGDRYNPILTISKGVEAPDDALSGNYALGENGWRFYRKIRVEKFQKEEAKDLRHVSISIYQSEEGNPGGRVRADVSGVFRTLASPLPPTQVMDVYILAVENVPGWWVNLSTLRPLVENAFGDLEAANPGLKFRQHWITRLSYGRDSYYRPQINSEKIASKGIDRVYFYPGRINRQGFWYYSPDLIQGQISVDGLERNIDHLMKDEELSRYPLADQFNSAMRFPDEERLFEKRKNAGLDQEPSLRMFLDDMNAFPEDFKNVLVINLHGELLPLPPIRNYSDAAKRPLKNPAVRVVTHPERIQVAAHDPIRLRVYSYATNPGAYKSGAEVKGGVSVFLKGVQDFNPIKIEKILGNSSRSYRKVTLKSGKIGKRVRDGVILNLKDVPLRHGYQEGGGGLPKTQRLYGMEYIPAPIGKKGDFSQNLLSKGNRPKNTARFIITIPSFVLPKEGVFTIETRLGTNNYKTGPWNYEPENLSRTYVWIDEEPPLSEQFQYMGDPRHNPYADIKESRGYNWFFKNISNAQGYFGYEPTRDGWSKEAIEVDLPRFFHMVRKALLKTHAVFTTMTGFSFYYIGLGGEIGSDRPNGFPDGLPVAGRAYGKRGTEMVKSITEGMQNVRAAQGFWYAKPWLGELVPDNRFREWKRQGNLSAGKKKGQFYRNPWSQMPGSGKGFDRHRRTDVLGSASFFNSVGKKRGPFNHVYSNKNEAIATEHGIELERIFNFPILEQLKAIRPFRLDYGKNFPPEWHHEQFVDTRNQARIIDTFYSATHPKKAQSSALIHLSSQDPSEGAYFVINGLSPAGETGTAYIGRYALVTLIQGFLLGGANPFITDRIPQLPLIEITYPKESAELVEIEKEEFRWDLRWERWDFQPYSYAQAKETKEDSSIFYVLKYSPDEGRSWYYVKNDKETKLGDHPLEEVRNFDNNFEWNLTDKKGNYIFRVEAFREEIPLHYAFHQIGVTVR